MRMSKMYMPTLRETPSEAEIPSHQLLLRAGMIRKLVSGVYSYLPLGYRAIKKVEKVVREEMDAAGSQELLMSAIQPRELWEASGRWENFGPEMWRLKDRNDREFCLGPTHEEYFTDLIKDEIKSYKQLPLSIYQIQTKYRDEKRPRFGLMRCREFIMKDAYTFHDSYESLDESYNQIAQAYTNAFNRLGLNFRSIIGDAGAMGGKDSVEFMALAESGEDTVVFSDESDYAANLEMATSLYKKQPRTEVQLDRKLVDTPGQTTIQEVAEFLDVNKKQILKSVLYMTDEEQPILAIVRGDQEVNEV